MAEAVVSVVLETLRDLLVEEARFLSGVSTQVKQVREELEEMRCLLKDADAKQSKDERIRLCIKRIRSLAYRVEDLVETYVIKVEARKSKSSGETGIKKFLKRFARVFGKIKSLHKLGTEIEKVRRDISNTTTSLKNYEVINAISEIGESSSSNQPQQLGRQTYAHEVAEYFVGMENDIKALVSLVTDDDKHRHRIISVLGMGGLGKTTLARKVYKHEDVQRCFERFAWTCVTQQAQIEVILRDILVQLLPERKDGVKSMEHRELARELHQVVMESKCLVVLDDIWKVDDWKFISSAFPSSTQGSITKVLLTTRTGQVAAMGFLYKLQGLSQMEGWELLHKILSSKGSTDFKTNAESFKEVGMELVSKCGGLPLAVSVLGGILKDKNSLAEWKTVNTHIGSYLIDREENGEKGGGLVGQVLSLSYNELPYHLKLCFLSFGNFEEDENIKAEHLYLIWIAEDLVLSQHKRDGESLKEVAERYLNELGNRSMVQLEVDELSVTGGFPICRIHDVMRDLCLDKCREEEFIKVIHLQNVKQPMPDSSYLTNNTSHRLVIHIDDSELNVAGRINDAQEDWTQTRSLYLRTRRDLDAIGLQDMATHDFVMLRSLTIEGFEFKDEVKFPFKLGNLIHLRMLCFRLCYLEELPSSIADLPLLHTIHLYGVYGVRIPNVLWKMKRLRHLYFDKSPQPIRNEKVRLHGLSELETFGIFDNECNEIADLSELVNLRFLHADLKYRSDDLYAFMDCIDKNCPKLQKIRLRIIYLHFTGSTNEYDLWIKVLMCRSLDNLQIRSCSVEFPSYEPGFLSHLSALSLWANGMKEDPMETLGQLPQLRYLELGSDSYLEEYLTCHEQGFPQLRVLEIYPLPNLKYWRVDEGSMPNLSRLKILSCKSLVMVPYGLRFAKHLKELRLEMSREFCDRVRVVDGHEGADYYKIQHVPLISLTN